MMMKLKIEKKIKLKKKNLKIYEQHELINNKAIDTGTYLFTSSTIDDVDTPPFFQWKKFCRNLWGLDYLSTSAGVNHCVVMRLTFGCCTIKIIVITLSAAKIDLLGN